MLARVVLVAALLTPVVGWATPSLDLPSPARPTVDVVEAHPRRYGLMAGGLTLFAAGWVADIGVTFGTHHDTPNASLIPLVGPLIQCGESYGYHGPMVATGNAQFDQQQNAQIKSASDLIAGLTYAGLAIDFAAQLTGLTLAIVGAATHKTELRLTRRGGAQPTRLSLRGRSMSISF